MEYLIGFVLGVVTEFFAATAMTRYQNSKLTRRFSKYKGRYIQCDLAGEPLNGEDLWTEITDADRNLLTVKGNDLGGLQWTSKILMDERFPGFGSGHYNYLSTNISDWGLHTIQIAESGEVILVQVQNISGGANKTYPLLWKKTRPSV